MSLPCNVRRLGIDVDLVRSLATNVESRSPSPQVHSYTKPEGLEAFTLEDPVTKSGSTLTYGPYKNIPQSTTEDFVQERQQHVTIHYSCDYPVIEVTKLTRTAEISHWGANLNIQDNVHLHNGGPR